MDRHLLQRLIALGPRLGMAMDLLAYSRPELHALRRELGKRRPARATRRQRGRPRVGRAV